MIEAGAGIANAVIEIAAGFDLKSRQHRNGIAVRFDHGSGNILTGTIRRKELKQRRVAEIFFQICTLIQILGIDFRDGEAVATEVLREVEESHILVSYVIENADRADLAGG